jgi:hypothetical protein
MADRKDDRQAILARRRFFVASALAGLASAQCDNPFRPCLEVASPPGRPDAAVAPPAATTAAGAQDAAPPQPCLEIAPTPPDASAIAPPAPAPTPATPEHPPQVCLKVAVPRDQRKR